MQLHFCANLFCIHIQFNWDEMRSNCLIKANPFVFFSQNESILFMPFLQVHKFNHNHAFANAKAEYKFYIQILLNSNRFFPCSYMLDVITAFTHSCSPVVKALNHHPHIVCV